MKVIRLFDLFPFCIEQTFDIMYKSFEFELLFASWERLLILNTLFSTYSHWKD